MRRAAEIKRRTGETDISVKLQLDGGNVDISTGIGFLTTCSTRLPSTADLDLR